MASRKEEYPEFFKMGEEAEAKFISVIHDKTKFELVRKAELNENRLQHWDLLIKSKVSNKEYKVEFKGIKKMTRIQSGSNENDAICLEIKGERGNLGWLYGSKADLYVFEIKTGYILVHRNKLLEYAKQFSELKTNKKSYSKELYKKYTRDGFDGRPKGDEFIFVPKEDIENIAIGIISK